MSAWFSTLHVVIPVLCSCCSLVYRYAHLGVYYPLGCRKQSIYEGVESDTNAQPVLVVFLTLSNFANSNKLALAASTDSVLVFSTDVQAISWRLVSRKRKHCGFLVCPREMMKWVQH